MGNQKISHIIEHPEILKIPIQQLYNAYKIKSKVATECAVKEFFKRFREIESMEKYKG